MSSRCTVLARFYVLTCSFDEFLQAVKAVVPALKNCPGFESAQLLAKEDQSEVATITTWKDRASYDALQANPAVIEAGIELFNLVQSGAVDMQIEVYRTIDSVQAEG